MSPTPAGYTYDDSSPAASPVGAADPADLRASVLWSEADAAALRRASEIPVPQTDQILDVWYGFVGANPHLVASFAGADGQPDGAYLAAVRPRFGRWIADVCTREYDDAWLAYREEVALRHHTAGKNRTDGVESPAGHVPLRHLIALVVPITMTIRDFLASGGAPTEEVDAMYNAWFKAVTLSVALWARPYNPDLW
ncbi:protoglobin domain-containing protein [Nocardioides sp. B-3]|uniref:protoglobin domain-containing protein n=1 Tax=Nocardioides sp. B-3 TaxID=2895565 RepID=UPI0021523704|nr:protoglobin domain-containing protein [Nocardioides sp. B-3]UUZ58619.1 protoglobin domain-containing protein [Nocardioides sp. B-3]